MAALDKWIIYDHKIEHIVDGKRVMKPLWTPHKGQLICANDYHRHQVLDAGRRFGKSIVGGKKLVPECYIAYSLKSQLQMDGLRREFWIVGPEYSDAGEIGCSF
jgi:hypothetical protein